ncbi:DUF1707 SHOCT-like domain-containing protein [Nocardia terpenica]|uniref:DUF1707 domain-containing protein n=1 Tax=Nocardia terpenica TaxID=455432 RepID=A0A6G9YXP3_9NOCA|nr:DUF1707 domain-containing protein [Nocardia terpenica]QIS17962.1 DUF1707 domain-containing protein [Nocardia terpenica]
MAETPDVRIGTAEREEAMRRLSDHFTAGRLSVAEFDERSGFIAAAVTRGDLAKIFADLPEPVASAKVASTASQAPARPDQQGRPELRGAMMGLTVLGALVLFFTLHSWLWLLLIPAVGILVGAIQPGQHGGGPAHRRHQRMQRRRERRGRY